MLGYNISFSFYDGVVDQRILFEELALHFRNHLNPIHTALKAYYHFQYGYGSHSSRYRKILESIILAAYSDANSHIDISHAVLDGSSQGVIGRNVTRNVIFSILVELHWYFTLKITVIQYHCLTCNFSRICSCLNSHILKRKGISSCLRAVSISKRPWSDVKNICDEEHRHTCGHATVTELKMFLKNDLWNPTVAA